MSQPLKFLKSIRIIDVLIIAVTVSAVSYGVYSHVTADKGLCKAAGTNYQLTLKDDAFSKDELSVHRCDSITVVNQDKQLYDLNFGKHDNHITYPGYDPQLLGQNESITIDALQTGTYEFHDHLRDKAEVKLTIEP